MKINLSFFLTVLASYYFRYYFYIMLIETNRTQVEARYLKVGDVIATGTVTHAPSAGIKTPKGKIDLGVNGYLKTWNKTTLITVLNR